MVLNAKQYIFCREQLIDLNTHKQLFWRGTASKLHRRQVFVKVDIQNRVVEFNNNRNSDVVIDEVYVLWRLVEIAQMDILDILNKDGSMKAISLWPQVVTNYAYWAGYLRLH